MFNPVTPDRYLLPTVYLFMTDIANPDLFGCCCRTWIHLDITCFYEGTDCHQLALCCNVTCTFLEITSKYLLDHSLDLLYSSITNMYEKSIEDLEPTPGNQSFCRVCVCASLKKHTKRMWSTKRLQTHTPLSGTRTLMTTEDN